MATFPPSPPKPPGNNGRGERKDNIEPLSTDLGRGIDWTRIDPIYRAPPDQPEPPSKNTEDASDE